MTLAGHSVALGGSQTFSASDLSNGVTGSGAVMLAVSPTTTGTLTGAAANFSGNVGIGTATPLGVLDVNGAPRFELATLGTNTVTLGTQSPAIGTTPYGWITVTCHDNSGPCRIPEFK
jgi:hypothetical protein